MMKRYKIVDNGYIMGLSSDFGIRISLEEYNNIQNALKNVPEVGPNQIARLKDPELIWVISSTE